MLFMGGLRILNIPVLFGEHQLPWFVGLPFTILWVLAITNAFNLIDGLDGLAAGSALFSTLVAFVVTLMNGYSLVTVMTIALAGAILGFLRYNFNPATIFLGDSGSLFIGFVLSALALAGAQKSPTIVAVAIPVVSFGLPILETSLSILRRLISGRPVFTADREHIHHKLLQHGLTHRQVVIVLYGVSAVFALLSLFLLWPTGSSLGLVLAVLGIGIWIGVQRLGYLELGELGRVAQRTFEQRQIFINNLAIRRATEELKVARDYEQIRRVLEAAFSSNDFDGFDVRFKLFPGESPPAGAADPGAQPRRGEIFFHWGKPIPGRFGSLDSIPRPDEFVQPPPRRHDGSSALFRARSPAGHQSSDFGFPGRSRRRVGPHSATHGASHSASRSAASRSRRSGIYRRPGGLAGSVESRHTRTLPLGGTSGLFSREATTFISPARKCGVSVSGVNRVPEGDGTEVQRRRINRFQRFRTKGFEGTTRTLTPRAWR